MLQKASLSACNIHTPEIHADSWAMVFPSTYDPPTGTCTAYAGTDGGIFINLSPPIGLFGCSRTTGWVAAESGLHVYASEAMAGLSRASSDCGGLPAPCP